MGSPAFGHATTALAGRLTECARLEQLLAQAQLGHSAVLVLRGEAGIGKSALLDYAAERAQDCHVLRAIGVEWEMELPFAGLHQLCAGLLDGRGRLPEPQSNAIATAFGLSSGPQPDRFLVGLAVLSLLSDAAEEHPLVCLVDDVQWLDRSSAQVLAFVARRLGAESVVLLFAECESVALEELSGLPALRAVAAQLNRLPGAPLDARPAPSRSGALSQIDDRDVYGAFEAATNRLFVASAANRATAIALEQSFNLIAAAQNRPAVHVTDVKPLPPKDPNGTAAFYAVVAWMFGGYIGATLIGLIGTPRSSSRKRAAARIGALAKFAVVAGILSVVMLRWSFGVFSGHVVALCAITALTIFASGAATAGIQAAAGPAGTGLVILAFVILGNSASGGPFARPLQLWRTIGGVLPPGASVDLSRSALFFDGARVVGPILVLVVWAVLGASLALALGGRIMNPADTEAAAAAGAAV